MPSDGLNVSLMLLTMTWLNFIVHFVNLILCVLLYICILCSVWCVVCCVFSSSYRLLLPVLRWFDLITCSVRCWERFGERVYRSRFITDGRFLEVSAAGRSSSSSGRGRGGRGGSDARRRRRTTKATAATTTATGTTTATTTTGISQAGCVESIGLQAYPPGDSWSASLHWLQTTSSCQQDHTQTTLLSIFL